MKVILILTYMWVNGAGEAGVRTIEHEVNSMAMCNYMGSRALRSGGIPLILYAECVERD